MYVSSYVYSLLSVVVVGNRLLILGPIGVRLIVTKSQQQTKKLYNPVMYLVNSLGSHWTR